eukprot:CAMPEP_0203826138 /NCGR_PEP_ID=MMETSP0115-20131106/55970_1 /ASSEMBLY_ACC=CAM_ASM_000227 /TAXON_ID=33651 /ORGANISM="Bicosoecid sp, Strain ms1" /LENGTH=52 /DNA_ID=CAMNT_0050735185 /DNA_START=45 /DNA_END=200 /DNA_ORIENTATION=+
MDIDDAAKVRGLLRKRIASPATGRAPRAVSDPVGGGGGVAAAPRRSMSSTAP